MRVSQVVVLKGLSTALGVGAEHTVGHNSSSACKRANCVKCSVMCRPYLTGRGRELVQRELCEFELIKTLTGSLIL